jgi:NitT/TauT family transport system substrate-binding protein
VKGLVRGTAAAVAAVLLSACGALDEGGGDGGSAAAPEGATTVRVGYLHTIAVDDKLWLGMEEGYFADEGLDIQATQFDTGIAVSQALAGGSIDVAIMGGVTSNFPAQGQGKIFMANSLETATARLFVQPDSGIQSVADLRGHTIATTEGTTADVYLHAALQSAGLTRQDVDVVNAAMPNAVQAFVSGSVDAIALWVPFDLRLTEAVPGAVEIDNAGNYPDAGVVDGWIANNAWYAGNQDTVTSIIRGWLTTNAAFREDPEGSLEKVWKAGYDGQAELSDLQHQVEYQTDFTNEEWLGLYESGEILDRVGQAEQAYVELGGVPQFVEPETFFDASLFIDAAKGAE